MNWLPDSESVEFSIAIILLNIATVLCHYISMICQYYTNRYNNRSQKALDLPLQNANIGKQALFFLRTKIRTKINHST